MPEWLLKKEEDFVSIQIIHNRCPSKNYNIPRLVWDIFDTGVQHEDLWKCLGCRQKVPNHIILQWKIINGK